jgi:hypothetical protein
MTVRTLTCFPDSNLHGEVEQIGVTVTHAVLVEKGRHNLATGRLKRDAECLVLDVGTQTASVDLDGRLRTKTQTAVAGTHHLCEPLFPGIIQCHLPIISTRELRNASYEISIKLISSLTALCARKWTKDKHKKKK